MYILLQHVCCSTCPRPEAIQMYSQTVKACYSLQNEKQYHETSDVIFGAAVLFFVFLKNKFLENRSKDLPHIQSVVCKFMCCPRNRCRICQHMRVAACTAQVDWRFSLMPLQVWIVLNCQATVCQTTPVLLSRMTLRSCLSHSHLPPLSPCVWGELYVFVEWAGYNFYAFGLQCNENEIMNMLTFQCFLSKSNMY